MPSRVCSTTKRWTRFIRAALSLGRNPVEATTRDALFAFLAEARTSLDIAVYDAHFDDETGDRLIAALDAAEGRGVRVRAVYNDLHRRRVPVPAPPEGPSLLQRLAAAVPATA